MKIQEVTSNVAIIEKNEKQYVRQILKRGIRGTSGTCSDEVTPDIDGFIDEPVIQCVVQVVKNTFVDDSKQLIQMIDTRSLQINFDVKLNVLYCF